jgi:hypothetical protein
MELSSPAIPLALDRGATRCARRATDTVAFRSCPPLPRPVGTLLGGARVETVMGLSGQSSGFVVPGVMACAV